MKIITATLMLLLLAGAEFAASSTTSSDGFRAYNFVRIRNIFDPNRYVDLPSDNSPSKAPPPSTTSRDSRPPYIALTGTMIREDKALGFFTGSAAEYNRVMGAGESIAGYNIREVSIAGAELEKEGKGMTLPVGTKVSLDGPDAGAVQSYYVEAPPAAPPSSSSAITPSSAEASRDAGSQSEQEREYEAARDKYHEIREKMGKHPTSDQTREYEAARERYHSLRDKLKEADHGDDGRSSSKSRSSSSYPSSSSSRTSSGSPSSSSSRPTGSSAAADELIRKMMERRMKETSK